MKKMLRNNKGFTLIELMIVVAIIGILAAIAIPNFMSYQCKAKQAEAKNLLGAARTAAEVYYAEYSTYTDTIGNTGFQKKGDGIYTVTYTEGTANGFIAQATGTVNGDTDTWTINENGTITPTANACD